MNSAFHFNLLFFSCCQANDDHYHETTRRIGIRLCDAFHLFKRGDLEKVISTLLPVHDELHLIGGSHAQRDVFTQLLFQTVIALKQR